MAEAKAKEKNVAANKNVQAMYEKDSKRYYRYLIKENDLGIVGTLYLPKSKEHVEEINIRFFK
jgi:hypothetical protein